MIDFDAPVQKRKPGRPRKTEIGNTPRKPVDLTPVNQDLPVASQGVNLEPGDNSRFLKHALTIRSWPMIDINDPVQVENRINEYFTLCFQDDIKPSVKGFLNSLRIAKSTLWEWKNGVSRVGTHQAIIVEAYNVLEALWEDYMQNGKINPVSGIFLGKNNFGYQDKTEYVVTPNTQRDSDYDPEDIRRRYLPDGATIDSDPVSDS